MQFSGRCKVQIISNESLILLNIIYSVSGLSCPGAEAFLIVIFHSFLQNNNINSDYILGKNIYFTSHGNFSTSMTRHNQKSFKARLGDEACHSVSQSQDICQY